MNEREWVLAKDKDSPLFKFRTFDSDFDLDPDRQGSLASLIRDSVIYCASPWDFNDPWEGRTAFAVPEFDVSSEAALPFIKAFCDIQSSDQRHTAELWLRDVGFADAARRMQDEFWRDNLRFSIFSLAGNAANLLLWGHYARGHRGYCLIFDQRTEPFASAAKVTYQGEYPVIDWSQWQTLDTLRLSLLTKATAWSYEEEYRVVLPREGVVEPLQIVPHNGKGSPPRGRYLIVPRDALMGVIFGGGMSAEYRAQIVQLARKYDRDIQFFKAGIHRRKYEVAITELTADEIDACLAPGLRVK